MAVALPTTGSTVEAGTGFIQETMGPAMEPLKAAGAALGNPLQTLNAPPVVMAAAAAMGTMFGGDDDKPDKKLKEAGKDLSESSDKLDESAEGLSALGSMLGLENLETILEDIRDSIFAVERAVEKTQEWLGKIFKQAREASGGMPGGGQIGGAPGERGAPQGQMKIDGKFAGFRKIREKVDPTAKLKAIEEKREAARAAKGKGGAPGAAPAEEEEEAEEQGGIMGTMMTSILKFLGPIIKIIKGLWNFSKAASKIFAKMFLPITIIMGIFSFISGFVDEFKKEGNIVESIKSGLMNVVDSLIDMPLNLIKDMISWIAGFLGFDEFSKELDAFEFDFSGLFGKLLDFIDPVIAFIAAPFTAVQDFIKGFQEGGFVEGMIQMVEGYIENIIDAPLNWIKGLVESVLRFFGAEDAAAAVGDFDFDLSGGVREAFTAISDKFTELWVTFKETLSEVWETIKGIFTLENIMATLSKGGGMIAGALGKLGGLFKRGGDDKPKGDGVDEDASIDKFGELSEQDRAILLGDEEAAIEKNPMLSKHSLMGSARRSAKMAYKAKTGEEYRTPEKLKEFLEAQDDPAALKKIRDEEAQIDRARGQARAAMPGGDFEPVPTDDKVDKVLKEQALQKSENEAAGAAPVVMNAPQTNNVTNTNSSGQVVMAAQRDTTKGGSSFEGADAFTSS